MVLENFCKNCGKRILPNQPYCPNCGNRTSYNDMDSEYILTIPIHNIGFFNFDIDFSPYINNIRRNFKYEICGCGFLNEKSNDFCPMCGTKRVNNRFYNLFKPKRDKNYLDNVLCDCGTINSKENSFCENCGNQLKKDEIHTFNNNYSNFNIEFDESVFCFCGQENEKNALFCTKCGRPIKSCGKNDDLYILCACSTLNEITSDYCIGCGADLKKENVKISCVCGTLNDINDSFCISCNRPLNPQRLIKSRVICSCGQILDFKDDYCISCGKNIKRAIEKRNILFNTVNNIKGLFR